MGLRRKLALDVVDIRYLGKAIVETIPKKSLYPYNRSLNPC